jgi:hypothetical protein
MDAIAREKDVPAALPFQPRRWSLLSIAATLIVVAALAGLVIDYSARHWGALPITDIAVGP